MKLHPKFWPFGVVGPLSQERRKLPLVEREFDSTRHEDLLTWQLGEAEDLVYKGPYRWCERGWNEGPGEPLE